MLPYHVCANASPVTMMLLPVSEFMGGACHRGLQRGAELLLQDAKEVVVDALKRHEGYRLVICGHSLGGGEFGLRLQESWSKPLGTSHAMHAPPSDTPPALVVDRILMRWKEVCQAQTCAIRRRYVEIL